MQPARRLPPVVVVESTVYANHYLGVLGEAIQGVGYAVEDAALQQELPDAVERGGETQSARDDILEQGGRDAEECAGQTNVRRIGFRLNDWEIVTPQIRAQSCSAQAGWSAPRQLRQGQSCAGSACWELIAQMRPTSFTPSCAGWRAIASMARSRAPAASAASTSAGDWASAACAEWKQQRRTRGVAHASATSRSMDECRRSAHTSALPCPGACAHALRRKDAPAPRTRTAAGARAPDNSPLPLR